MQKLRKQISVQSNMWACIMAIQISAVTHDVNWISLHRLRHLRKKQEQFAARTILSIWSESSGLAALITQNSTAMPTQMPQVSSPAYLWQDVAFRAQGCLELPYSAQDCILTREQLQLP